MQIFLTGASGFIGQKVADQLLSNGHGVTALARSDETAKQLAAKGLKVGPLTECLPTPFSKSVLAHCWSSTLPCWRLQHAHVHVFG